MRVVQSTWGTFHQFDLARQLHARGQLEALFSSFPWIKLKRFGLPREKVRSTTWRHAFFLLQQRWGLRVLEPEQLRGIVRQHMREVTQKLPLCDAFVALSGAGLEAGRMVQKQGGIYVCDRGSSHIRYGEHLLAEEFRRWGQPHSETLPEFVEREEVEYAEADAISVPSEFARRSFIEMGVDSKKLHRIPLGVDVRRFQPAGKPSPNTFRVLFVGQISFRKGIPYLLEAFRGLRHPRKELVLVGAVCPEMEGFLADRSWENVRFIGPVPQAELPAYMSQSQVLVLPSIEDGFGMVLAQAMACGCPCISTTNTGGPDLFRDGKEGFIVPIRDPRAITERLEALAANPTLRDQMSRSALSRIQCIGGWNEYGVSYSRLLEELISGNQTRALRPLSVELAAQVT